MPDAKPSTPRPRGPRVPRILESRVARYVLASVLVAAVIAGACWGITSYYSGVNESGIDWTPDSGGSDEERVSGEVTELMETLQNPADNDLDAVIAKLKNTQRLAIDLVKGHGIDIPDLCQHLFSTATYTVGDVSVEGTTATVQLSMAHRPFGMLANQANDDFSSLMGTEDGAQLMSQGVDALLARYEQLFLARLDASSQVVDDDFEVHLTKTNGTWTIDSASIRDMAETLVEGVDLPLDL